MTPVRQMPHNLGECRETLRERQVLGEAFFPQMINRCTCPIFSQTFHFAIQQPQPASHHSPAQTCLFPFHTRIFIMRLPTSTLATRRTEYVVTLETLPVDILCLILEQSNSISDLINATHGCPALLRTRNIFEKQIVFATLCNQFDPGELLPIHLACTLPASEMFEICDFENKLETVRASKPQNTAGHMSPTKFRMSLHLGHQIEAFHKTLLQLMDRYYNDGPGSPIDPEDLEISVNNQPQYVELHSGFRRGCNSPHVQEPESVPNKIERLRFLHALCNLEIVRKLIGSRWYFGRGETTTWKHCVREMKKVFSIHDWGSMNSVISFLDDHTQPCKLKQPRSILCLEYLNMAKNID